MATKAGVVIGMALVNFPSFLRQRTNAIVYDAWYRGKQNEYPNLQGDTEGPFVPHDVTDEYTDLATRSPNQFAGLMVSSLAQTMYVDGVRRPGSNDNMAVYDIWQRNRMDSRQNALHRGAISTGIAFAAGMPGTDPMTGAPTTVIKGYSAKKMAAFYQDVEDEWPVCAIWAEQKFNLKSGEADGWTVDLWDETAVHRLECKGDGNERSDWTYVQPTEHNAGVTPVVRYCKELDLDGRSTGAIEPHLPLLRRIDQNTFDRLIVQRFGAWKVRYIAGMAKPDSQIEADAQALKLRIQDMLISTSPDTKFGTLDGTDITQFIASGDADLRYLSAVSQIPPHHLLGLSSNLQAEALAAAEGGLQRQSADVKMNFGESHEQLFRLVAHMSGLSDEAEAFDMQVRWRDTESRSLAQAAAALGQLALNLHVPVEMLWERIPGWTDADSERAKELVQNGSIDQMIAKLEAELGGQGSNALESNTLAKPSGSN